jgi:thioredoxin 1
VNLTIERNEHGKLVQIPKQLVRVDAFPSTLLDVNAANFHEEVENSKIPVVIDVKADWCVPCREMAPILDQLKKEYAGRVKFVRVDTDNSPGLINIADADTELVYPSIAFYNPGSKQAPTAMGARDKDSLKKFIDRQLEEAKAR